MKHLSLKRAPRHSILAVLILGLVFSIATKGRSHSLSPKDHEQVFEKVWKDIDDHYYDPEFGGVNWQEIHRRYQPLVSAAKDDKDFYSVLDRMTAELHDAHTRFSSPEQWRNHEKHQVVSLGFRPGYVEGKVVVLDVIPESNAARAGIEPGMIVTALDGQPITERLAESAKHVLPSSSERVTELRVLGNAFAGSLETPFAVSLQRADGTQFEAKFTRQVLSNAPHVTFAKLASGFGYLRFDEFQPALVKDFKAALEDLRDRPGLILDLRWNRGGVGATLEAMAGFFFESKTLFERRMTRKQVAVSERDGHHSAEMEYFVGKKRGQIYSGSVVILVSEYSASATEVFAAGMQDSGRATLVGSQSCGCVLGITHDRVMRGGGVLEISEVLWFSPKARKLEGEGVIPDRVAVPTIASLQEKRDPVLDEGIRVLKELSGARRSEAPLERQRDAALN
ncbi:MAG TPA: S41 family peptidase [Candidatus Acidoferrum sp.]|nr:S41 family peptidase [Candidatus Acidoferrum sp.]